MTEPEENVSSNIDDLLYEALELPPEQRRNWLHERCQRDSVLLEEVLSLLDAHEASGQFLESGVQWPQQEGRDLVGTCVGVYQIDSLIAFGGMGHVYKAHRNDGSYEQTVAIKVVEQGYIQTQLFQAERQILADLNHPAITTILDGGVMPDSGHPYLVMECIDGMPITDYIYHQQCTRQQRIDLFITLLGAVELAHQHGIIHCDLKPANVFVDQGGDLKLLDFGVAYAVERSRQESGEPVKHYGITPGYSSPQRLAGERPVIADDIYALGILFALVMVDADPFRFKTALSSGLQKLASALDDEARAIFDKATHIQPELRYTSADAFIVELNNWVQHQPLNAVNGGVGYKLKKSIQRNWGRWLTIGLLLGVMASSFIAWWQNERAIRAQELIELQVDVAVQLAESVVRDLDIKVVLLKGSTLIRLNAAHAALERLEEINRAQPNHTQIQLALAQTHIKIGGLLAHPFLLHIGEIEKGRQHIRKAYQIHKAIYKREPNQRNLMALVVSERFIAAQLVVVEGKLADGLKLATQRLPRIKQLGELTVPSKSRLGTIYSVVAHILVDMGKFEEARVAYAKGAKYLRPPDPKQPEHIQERMRRGYHFFLDEKALLALALQDYASARQQMRDSIQRHEGEMLWVDRSRVIRAHHALACMDLLGEQDALSAVLHFRQAKAIAGSLITAFPAATSLKWQAERYAGLDVLLAGSVNQSTATQVQKLVDEYQCNTPRLYANPAGPPEGWASLRDQLTFSFVDVLEL